MRLKKLLLLPFAYTFFMLINQSAFALPPDFQEEILVTGFNKLVYLTQLPDGRMLVAQQKGTIRIFDPQVSPVQTSIYLDINNIEWGGERGLSSMALDPDFTQNGYIYIYYTHGSTARNRISRFTHNGNQANLSSEFLVWEDNEDWMSCCHFGGGLGFGPDGKLYLTTGEEFDGAQAQDLSRAGGKIIRINKDGTIPQDNPFVDDQIYPGALDEIWAYGLRNPYRAHWDLVGNRFYIGEVGGNVQSTAREDLHVGRAGANYGWPVCEGQCADPAYDDPIYDYGHTTSTPNGGAITAGFVYHGNLFPQEYDNVLFISDYALGWIKYLKFNPDGTVLSVNDFANGFVGAVVHLIEGLDGALYYVDYLGYVRRIVYNSSNQAPVINSFSATPTTGLAPLLVQFTVDAMDSENDPLSYRWIFGDGNEVTGTDPDATNTYGQNGLYQAQVEVSDGNNTTLSAPLIIQVGNPPAVTIVSPIDGSLFLAGDTINFSGTATDPDETIPAANYSWEIEFIHNAHTHPGLSEFIGTSGQFPIETTGHDFHDETGYSFMLTVTDSDGLTGSDLVEIYPDKVDLTFDTVPSGSSISIDGIPTPTPFIYDTLIQFEHEISVPQAYCSQGTNYVFDSWSDGGAATHQIIVPNVNTTYIANYIADGNCNLPQNGLVLHLESDSGITTTGTTVDSWADQSGMGNDLFSSGNPQLVPDVLNGHPAIDFDGATDKLERTSTLAGFPAGNANRTVYLVANYLGTGYGGFAYGTNSCNQTFGTIVNPSGRLMIQGWCNDFASSQFGTGTGWLIQSAILESDQLSHYLDNLLIDSRTHTYNTVLTNMVLGAELDSNPHVEMLVSAVLVYDRALNTTEHDQVLTYLQEKYFNTGANQPPVANDDAGTVETAGSITLMVLANDTDADGTIDPTTVTLVQSPGEGTAQVNPVTGDIDYTHNGGSATSDSLTYEVMDNGGLISNEATVTITIDNGLQPPVANDDADTVATGSNITLDILANDTDADGTIDPTTVTLVQVPGEGTAQVNPVTGAVDYTHSGGIATFDIFTYTVNDNDGLTSNEATVTITINAALQPPVANDDSGLVANGETITLAVVANDTDADGTIDPTTVALVQLPGEGTAQVNAVTGEIDYTHNGGSATSDTFTYEVMDNDGLASNEATVTITVSNGSQPPSAGLVLRLESDLGVLTSGTTVTGWSDQSGLSNDLIAAGDPQLIADALNGQPVIDFDGTGDKLERTLALTGFPSGNANRTVYFVANYRSGGYGGFAYGTTSCNQTFGTIVRPNGRLMIQGWCSDFQASEFGTGAGWLIQSAILESSQLSHYLGSQLIDSRTHTYNTVLTNMVMGAELDSNPFMDMQVAAVLVYDRALSAAEHDQALTYLQEKYFNTTNQPPVANDDADTVANSGSVTVAVVSNDTDADGTIDPTTVALVQLPGEGTAQVNAVTGEIDYTHNGGAATSDTFTYTVNDNDGLTSNEATVTITINPALQPPVANDDADTVANSGSVTVAVVSNDTDADGTIDPTTVALVQLPGEGTAQVNAVTGEIDYTHNGGAATSDTFTYTVNDNDGLTSNEATVTITINPALQPPVANDDADTVANSGSVTVAVVSNDTDADGTIDPTTVALVQLPGEGTAQVNAVTGEIDYTHNGGAATSDTFTYTVNDNDGLTSNEATVTITINPALQPPVANDDADTVANSGSVTVAVVSNDTDADGTIDPTTVALVQLPGEGTAQVNAVTGEIDYTHNGGAATSDTFTYTVNDNDGLTSNEATVTITINPALQPPVANDDANTVANSGSVTVAVVSNDTDADGTIDPTTVALVQLPGEGTAQVNAVTGEIDYTHNGGAATSDTFTYTVNDNDGLTSNEATVTITINPALQPPVANDDADTVANSGLVTIAVVSNDTDADGTIDPTTVALVQLPGEGTAQVNAVTGEIDYTHNGGAATSDTFTYTVNDNDGLTSNEATVTITINPALQPPVANDDADTVANSGLVTIAVVSNDTDADGTIDPTTVALVQLPGEGTAQVNAVTGEIDYTHNGGAATSDTFTYTVNDNDGLTSNEATVTITINAALQPPVANNDAGTVANSGSVTVAVVSNDTDADGTIDPTTVALVQLPGEGTAQVNAVTGEIDYTHNGGAATSDTFTYTVNDNDGLTSNEATVTITISTLPNVGLVLRLESDSGVSASGTTVTGWTDQSGFGNDLTAAGDPQILADVLNGQPVIDFDGTGDKLERTLALTGFPSGNADRTVYFVANYRSGGFGGFAFGTNSCNQAFGTVVRPNGRLMIQGWCSDFPASAFGTGAGWLIQSAVLESKQLSHYLGNQLIDSRRHTYNTVLTNMVLGAELDSNPFMDMQVAAVLVYDRALSAAEQTQVLDYLQNKYFQ